MKIFLAHRGELLRRLARSAKAFGLETAAFAPARANYLDGLIDDYREAPKPWGAELFLDAEALISSAKGCHALHPGFGFMSERADFASQVEAAGINWIGPKPEAMSPLSDKATARQIAEDCGVPCLPALKLDTASKEEIEAFCAEHGFPLLIKACHGGGGRGMRLVTDAEALDTARQQAAAEAKLSFASAELLLEPYIPVGRHVEVQIIGDQHGNIFSLGVRDCSLQRRRQKVIEEAPAPLPEKTSEELSRLAKALAKKVGYTSLGTVEFLLDPKSMRFYFLEMNTRLQVEHRVTEAIYGWDLVYEQFRIAHGEIISPPPPPRGHSFEARIYAEDPEQNFLPSPGRVKAFVPYEGEGIHWDVGLDLQGEVEANFDPMVAKIITWAADREKALSLMEKALAKTIFIGPKNNREYLLHLARNQPLRSPGKSSTSYLDQAHNDLIASLAAARQEKPFVPNIPSSPNRGNIQHTAFSQETTMQHSHTTYASDSEVLSFGQQKDWTWVTLQGAHSQSWLLIDGILYQQTSEHENLAEFTLKKEGDEANIQAPVPGKVLRLEVNPGDEVEAGQTLAVLESMKMEFVLSAPKKQKVAQVLVDLGEQVSSDQTIIILK